MQNKKVQKQLQKDLRRMHEQVGAMVLIVGMLAGTVTVSSEARRVLSGLALQPVFAIIKHSSHESETARHPIRLDAGLRNPTISGI